MKKRIKNKWLKALRSGEYKQGMNALVDKDDNFCCLGVLCNLHALETNGEWDKSCYSENCYKNESTSLPKVVMDWAGMKHVDGVLPKMYKVNGSNTMDLSGLNDFGMSFKKIANIIEKNYEVL